MDETKIERTPTGTHTTINQTTPRRSGSNGTMWFLMGGVVVLIAVVAYFVMGEGTLTSSSGSQPTGGNVSINVDTNNPPASETAPAETAPAETAPAETAPAPAPQAD